MTLNLAPRDVAGSIRSTRQLGSGNARYRNLLRVPASNMTTVDPFIAAMPLRLLPDAEPLVAAIIRRGDSAETRRAYAGDLGTFARWLEIENLDWKGATADDLDRYRDWLSEHFARTTCNRRLTVVRALYGEAVRRRVVIDDPAARLRGLRGRDERDGGALTRRQAQDVLATIRCDLEQPVRQLIAIRDLAIVSVLIRTGIRRSELADLKLSSLGQKQGYPVLTIIGKGNVQRTIKLPVDVRRQIDQWLTASAEAGRDRGAEGPLFVEVRRGGMVVGCRPLSDRAVYDVVGRRLVAAGLDRLGPHGLRATFVTLALEGGAQLHLVQRAAGHADPRTTERYWRRKDALDENAVDYIHL
jgi:integrase/recombinase XerD